MRSKNSKTLSLSGMQREKKKFQEFLLTCSLINYLRYITPCRKNQNAVENVAENKLKKHTHVLLRKIYNGRYFSTDK